MDIRTIKLFLHLCDSLHFAKTAQQMHMSPSTLSRALQRLEDEVGAKLLQRDNRSVTITSAGLEFQQFAQQTLQSWQTMRSRIGPHQDLLRGKINIFCSVTAAYSHLPELLDQFRREHPLVEISLRTGDPANAVTEVMQNRADIAIAALPDTFPNSLHFSKIEDIPLSVIAPNLPGPLQEQLNQKQIDWPSLPFIVQDHGPGRKRADNWFSKMGFKPQIYAQVSGHEAVVSMVALGFGLSITPEVVVTNSPVRDRIQMLQSPIDIPVFELGCCCKQNRYEEPAIKAFLEVL